MARVPRFKRYFEPFIGGGALFFALRPVDAVISDVNADLINAYQVVRDDVERLIRALSIHRYEQAYYYHMRAADRDARFRTWPRVRRASRLIFLNRTCFNGLYRVNARGHFNVPFGRYQNPTIVDRETLRRCSLALQDAEIKQASFLECEEVARKGDFVYFDPPYVPLSATSSFTNYSADGFDAEMQRELFKLCVRLHERGVKFMLSNSSAPFVRHLYQRFHIEEVFATRAINSKAGARGRIPELIIRNYR
jgi:DNA adenine methylase